MKSICFNNIAYYLLLAICFLLVGCDHTGEDKSDEDLPCKTIEEIIQKYPNVRKAEETNLTPDSCALKFETVEEFEKWIKAMNNAKFESK